MGTVITKRSMLLQKTDAWNTYTDEIHLIYDDDAKGFQGFLSQFYDFPLKK